MAIINHQNGDNGWSGCLWSRKKTNCCKVRKPLPPKLECTKSSCVADPLLCAGEEDKYGNYKRSSGLDGFSEGVVHFSEEASDDSFPTEGNNFSSLHALEKRGRRGYSAWFNGIEIISREMAYGNQADFMRAVRNNVAGIAQVYWWMRSRRCSWPQMGRYGYPHDNNGQPRAPEDVQIEHILPTSFLLGRFVGISANGRLLRPVPFGNRQVVPDGPATRTPRTNIAFWQDQWNAAVLDANNPVFAGHTRPSEFIAAAAGSSQDRSKFVLVQSDVNGIKGRLEVFNAPMAQARFDGLLRQAIRDANETAVEMLFAVLRGTVAVFEYSNDPMIASRSEDTRTEVRRRWGILQANFPNAQGVVDHWDEAFPHSFGLVSRRAREWLFERIEQISREYEAEGTPFRDFVLSECTAIRARIIDCYYAWEKPHGKY